MNETRNIAQMHVRLSRYLPRELAAVISPAAIDKALAVAWANGWRDPEWIATYALEGTEQGNVRDPAALFMSRLRDAAEMPCPEAVTPEPPAITEVMRSMHGGHDPARNPRAWAERIREQMRALPRGASHV
jgi:hypothetical protein